MTREQQFVQVIHVPGHWLTITNYNNDTIVPGHWYVYDSLNNARYIPHLKTALKKLDNDMSSVVVHHFSLTYHILINKLTKLTVITIGKLLFLELIYSTNLGIIFEVKKNPK